MSDTSHSAPSTSAAATPSGKAAAAGMGLMQFLQWLVATAGTITEYLDTGASSLSMHSQAAVAILKNWTRRGLRILNWRIWAGIGLWMLVFQTVSLHYVWPRHYIWYQVLTFAPIFIYLTLLYWVFSALFKALDMVTKLPEVAFKIEVLDERHGLLMDIKQTLNHARNNMGLLCAASIMNHTLVGEFMLLVAGITSYVSRHTSGREDQVDAALGTRTITAEWKNGGVSEKLEVPVEKDNPVQQMYAALPANFLRLLRIFRLAAITMFLMTTVQFLIAINTACGSAAFGLPYVMSLIQGYDVGVVCEGGNADLPDAKVMYTMDEGDKDALEKAQSPITLAHLERMIDKIGSETHQSKYVPMGSDPLTGVKNLSGESCHTGEDGEVTPECFAILAMDLKPGNREKLKRLLNARMSWNVRATAPERAVLQNVMSLADQTKALGRLSIAMDAACWFGNEVGCPERIARFGGKVQYDVGSRELKVMALDRKNDNRDLNRGFWEAVTGRDLFQHRTVSLKGNASEVLTGLKVVLTEARDRKDEVVQGYWVEALTFGLLPGSFRAADQSASEAVLQEDTAKFYPKDLPAPVKLFMEGLNTGGKILLGLLMLVGLGLLLMLLLGSGGGGGGGKKDGGGGGKKDASH